MHWHFSKDLKEVVVGWKQSNHRGRDWCNATTSQGIPVDTRNWKMQGMASPVEPPEEVQSCQHFGFCPVILISDFYPPEVWDSKFVFLATKCVVIGQSSHRELMQELGCKQCRFLETEKICGQISRATLGYVNLDKSARRWSGDVEERVRRNSGASQKSSGLTR